MAYPRVSEILRDLGFSESFGTAYHLARGQALHKAIHLDLRGVLDESTIHPDIAPGISAFRTFRQQMPFVLIAAELELACDWWRFQGHPDLIAVAHGLTTLYDYKYTESPDLFAAKHQVGAYKHLWDRAHPDQPIVQAAIIQLRPGGGGYRLHPIAAPDLISAQHTFLAGARVWHALKERRNGRHASADPLHS